MRFIFILVTAVCFTSCQENSDAVLKIDQLVEKSSELTKTEDSIFFNQVKDYPLIADTSYFIAELVRVFNLELEYTDFDNRKHEITTFEKVKLKDATEEIVMIEYSFPHGAGVLYPWKYQVIMTLKGRPIKVLQALRYEYLNLFKDDYPYLLTLASTDKGNGRHSLYRMKNDSLENVLTGFKDYFPRTYDAYDDYNINVPNELDITILDEDKDGFNDIIFNGAIQSELKSVPVSFTFLYDKKSNYFNEKENYSEKYLYLDSL
ncbi:MAG: hypothetical protein GQ574_25990 [Crocinitomix sp.]|nr:hypothetical protein [Crocinitomix sp.]